MRCKTVGGPLSGLTFAIRLSIAAAHDALNLIPLRPKSMLSERTRTAQAAHRMRAWGDN